MPNCCILSFQTVPSFTINVLINQITHTIKNKAEAAYARSDLIEKRKEMMEQWAEYLAR
jgi:hypothetical protein